MRNEWEKERDARTHGTLLSFFNINAPSAYPGGNSCYSPQSINQLGKEVFLHLPQIKTHIAIALGAGALSGVVAVKAARDYADGKFSKIVSSGGVIVREADYYESLLHVIEQAGLPVPDDGETEGDYMARVMIARGVAPGAIERETESTNTGENISFAREWLENAPSITLVCLSHLQRRALGTLRAYTGTPATTSGIHPFPGIDESNWHLDHPVYKGIVRGEVIAEVGKIAPYIEKKFCALVDVAAETQTLQTIAKLQKAFLPRVFGL